MSRQHTAVIIVSFGRVDLMKQTLRTLLSTKPDVGTSITVVDNGSQQEMIGLLMDYRNRIDNLVLLNENRGKPYAWNLGATVSRERCKTLDIEPPNYYLFCDNDLRFKADWHTTLLQAYREHKDLPLCGLSGFRWPSHDLNVQTGRYSQINVVRFPPGCCVFMSAEAYRANGPWDTGRLIRAVDTNYFRNARRRGFVNASIHPHSVIEHTGRTQRTWHIRNGTPKLLP